MLELRDVCRWYGSGETRVDALQAVTLSIAEGEFVAVRGPSGSGKSTLLQIIGLLDRPSAGSVLLGGQDVGTLSDAERTRRRLRDLGFVFQRFHLLPGVSAVENVAIPMEAAGVPIGERYARAAALLQAVGLGKRLTFPPEKLSGGQRQRVAIARALANGPKIILADEPTGNLHSDDRDTVVELLRRFQREGRTVVVVTHDAEVAAVAERCVEIRDGRVQELPPGTEEVRS
jgi:ABC-type lipoprotein export system ATPase subunit